MNLFILRIILTSLFFNKQTGTSDMRQDSSRHSNDSQHQHGGLGDSVGVYGLFNVYPLVSGQTKFLFAQDLVMLQEQMSLSWVVDRAEQN